MGNPALFIAVFLACAVEAVEALTIVLAAGVARGWRSAITVAMAGLLVRAPLSRVPENAMKFVVGVMLTAFGMYWGAEDAGVHWPGSDLVLLILIPAVGLYALVLVVLLRRRHHRLTANDTRAPVGAPEPRHS